MIFSCNAQRKTGASVYHVSKDAYGDAYMIECLNKEHITAIYYIDTLGHKIEVCKTPESHALIWEGRTEFLQFVDENLVQRVHQDIEGKVYIALYIDERGSIVENRIIKTIEACPECTAFAKELVGKIKPKRAALMNGRTVKSIEVIAIPFK